MLNPIFSKYLARLATFFIALSALSYIFTDQDFITVGFLILYVVVTIIELLNNYIGKVRSKKLAKKVDNIEDVK